jgi:hypothetical protein
MCARKKERGGGKKQFFNLIFIKLHNWKFMQIMFIMFSFFSTIWTNKAFSSPSEIKGVIFSKEHKRLHFFLLLFLLFVASYLIKHFLLCLPFFYYIYQTNLERGGRENFFYVYFAAIMQLKIKHMRLILSSFSSVFLFFYLIYSLLIFAQN